MTPSFQWVFDLKARQRSRQRVALQLIEGGDSLDHLVGAGEQRWRHVEVGPGFGTG
jgi:hypothetical protein